MDPPARGKEEGEDVAREAMREPRKRRCREQAKWRWMARCSDA